MEGISLNVFQRIMRLWDDVHPYNAAQVVRIAGSPDVSRISQAWSDTLATLGLGRVFVHGNSYRHEASNGEATSAVNHSREPLDDLVSREMNARFDLPDDPLQPYCPFRTFVREDAGFFDLGIIYHHWVADSASIRMLLCNWFHRLFHPAGARTASLNIARNGYWRFFGPGRGRWTLGEGVLAALRGMTRFANARRILSSNEDYTIRCTVHPLADGTIDRLCAYTRKRGVTINDLFLAATAQACHQHGVNPAIQGRQELALGTVVDLRSSCGDELSDVFGLFLGFTTVIARDDVLDDWPRLLCTIASQNTMQKRCATAQASQIRMAAAVAESLFLPPKTWVRFYQRHLPLAAGISNVNLNKTWAAPFHPHPILDYFRFSPTGPAIPLLFTPSSLGRKSHLAISYRTALVDEARAARIVHAFIDRLEILAKENGSEVELKMTGATCQ